MLMIEIGATALLLLQPAAAQKAPPSKPAPAAKPAATDLAVTVSYKGKGMVDGRHRIIVWIFSDANVTSASRPLDTQFVTTNGDTVVFKNAPAAPVYVFAVYDEKGGYDGISGPPPHGLPSSLYRKAPKTPPVAVKAGGPAIKFTFDDSERWNK